MNFTAIDFETANYYRDSACALGLTKVKDDMIIKEESFLIRPPTKWFMFTYLHGITYQMVKDQPTFGELWPKIRGYFRGVDFIVGHSVGFDKSVLKACCNRYRIEFPDKEFWCTVKLSRELYKIYPTKLPDVCKKLKIKLNNHHDALDDSKACAKIMIKLSKKL